MNVYKIPNRLLLMEKYVRAKSDFRFGFRFSLQTAGRTFGVKS